MNFEEHLSTRSTDAIESSLSGLLVSVIIPVYSDQAGLDNCLKALEKQSFPSRSFEVIVVDNASQPKMVLPKDINLNCIQEICTIPGSYAARNVGMRIARGDVLAFLDADCKPEKDWLERGLNAVQTASPKTLIGGEVKITLSPKPTAVELYQYQTGFGQQYNVEQKYFSATACLFVRREQALLIGEFNQDLLSGGDREWSWRAMALGFGIKFSPGTQVTTAPRKNLGAAIKQVRRIAGGRYHFNKLGLDNSPEGVAGLLPRRGAWEASWWLLIHTDLSLVDRLRVFSVAVTLKLVQIVETFRLKRGTSPERC